MPKIVMFLLGVVVGGMFAYLPVRVETSDFTPAFACGAMYGVAYAMSDSFSYADSMCLNWRTYAAKRGFDPWQK